LVSWRSCQFLCLAFLSRRAVSNGFVQKIIASKESNFKQVYLQQFDSCNYLYEWHGFYVYISFSLFKWICWKTHLRSKLNLLWERLGTLCGCVPKKFKFFFLIKFNMVCTFWIVLICWCQKWFLKNKKNHWHVFWHEKLFEKHPQSHCQTRSFLDMVSILISFSIPGEILYLLATLGLDYCTSYYLLVTG
jgi:hypothetical protein